VPTAAPSRRGAEAEQQTGRQTDGHPALPAVHRAHHEAQPAGEVGRDAVGGEQRPAIVSAGHPVQGGEPLRASVVTQHPVSRAVTGAHLLDGRDVDAPLALHGRTHQGGRDVAMVEGHPSTVETGDRAVP
jgi:hypothetical protein